MQNNLQTLIERAPQNYDPGSDSDDMHVATLADELLQENSATALADLEVRLKESAAPLGLQLAVKLARSKRMIGALKQPVFVSIVFAMYKEHTRIQPRAEHPEGEDFLRRKLAQLHWLFDAHPASHFELVAVDDGCPENSGQLAAEIAREADPDHCRVLFLDSAIREGHAGAAGLTSTDDSQKGGSILFGMAEAAARKTDQTHIVIFTDADIATHLGQVGLLVDAIANGAAPVAIGSRRETTSVVVKQGKRNDRGKLFIYLWKRLLPQLDDIIDTQCGFKAFRADLLTKILPGIEEKRFAFDIELLLRAALEHSDGCRKVAICWIDSEAASTTTDIQPYLPMLKSVARMYRQYLPANERADRFADFLEQLTEPEWQTLLENIPAGITTREPASFGDFDEVGARQLHFAAGLDVFTPVEKLMQSAGSPGLAIASFRRHYEQLLAGESGLIGETDIEPVIELPDAEMLEEELESFGKAALEQTVLIKLNGGLGTGMGLREPKSLLNVKNGYSFLDLIAQQSLQHGCPLVLMNRLATRGSALKALGKYPELERGLPLDFLQHRIPKLDRDSLLPVQWPTDAQHEWCPPGHGDIYHALLTSGVLDAMEQAGLRYAFVSNADNLGATLDPRILGYLISRQLPLLMEVADRTKGDRKGGHLARRDGQLILRESAQCADEDRDAFRNIKRHRYFNTNNLWLDLKAVRAKLNGSQRPLPLPLLRNAKTVDPRDPDSTPVYQLESAMGSGIELFDGAEALRVPRRRFAPVKSTADLLWIRSDATSLTRVSYIVPAQQTPPTIKLDRHYRLIEDFEAAFPFGPPSLLDCRSLRIRGPFVFGKDIRVQGHVRLQNDSDIPQHIPDGTLLKGSVMKARK